jgi:tyrosyl-tRNA synthetase
MAFAPLNEQMDIIRRGTVDLLPEDELVRKLENSIKTNKPLIIKQGFDPTAPDIHLGHTVGIRKLKHFQDLGHQVVVIIGDYTAMVGDPSEKNSTRPRLTHEEVIANAKTYQEQFFKILDKRKTQIRYNGDWFSKMSFDEIMALASKFTVARMLERDDFSNRYSNQLPISIHEFFYPLMQGYDSVMLKADVEIGATEQKFNLVIARQIQKEYNIDQQIVLTLPVLPGVDGSQRMSKSLGNYIGIDEPANETYGKAMSIPDELIYPYFELISDVNLTELKDIKKQLQDPSINPRDLKKFLARTIVKMYHGEKASSEAEKAFEKIFVDKNLPDNMPEFAIGKSSCRLDELLIQTKTADSKSNARRLIKQGGVSVNGDKISDPFMTIDLNSEIILKVGKRKFAKIIPQKLPTN